MKSVHFADEESKGVPEPPRLKIKALNSDPDLKEMVIKKQDVDDCLTISKTCQKLAQSHYRKAKLNQCDYFAFSQNQLSSQIRGYVVVDHCCQKIYCVFLGTKGWRDLRFDLKFKKVQSPFCDYHLVKPQRNCIKGRIHYGFYQIYNELLIELNTLLNKITTKYSTYQLLLTGHSMGGVLAIFYSLRLLFEDRILGLILFCLPKFGDRTFNRSLLQFYHDKTVALYKTRNFWDPVTRLPPSLFGYESLYKYNCSDERCQSTEYSHLGRKPHSITNVLKKSGNT